MKITKRQLRRIIKESAMAPLRPFSEGFSDIDIGVIQEAISSEPTGRVEVEWDFSGVEGFTDDGLSYEEAEAKAGLPPVVAIPPDIMGNYKEYVDAYGEEQADQEITDWLSDELGWLHYGWSWV